MLGPAPVTLHVDNLAELLGVTAELGSVQPFEKRIHVSSPQQVELYFRFGPEVTPMMQHLGLKKVLIFDFSATATFAVDHAELKPDLAPLLGYEANILNQYFAGVQVFACGHTDASGSAAHNLDLSIRRAQSVANFLIGHGVDTTRIVVQGFGPDYPLEANDTEAGRASNRRTELVLPQ